MNDRPAAWPALLLLILLASPVRAQTAPAAAPPADPEAEAPAALFDQKIGDVGVLLDAQGTWTTRLAGGLGAGFSPQGTLPGLGYPGYEKGAVFSQVPDFTLTLKLLERYYLDIVFGGTLEDRTFLVGYEGKKDEPVQWVKAGNTPFTVPDRAGQGLAQGRKGAPAAGAAFSLGPVSTEVLARYEDGSREVRTYRGYREVSAALVSLDQWIRGRFFRLPGKGPFTGIQVLTADPAGPLGNAPGRYRQASAAEAAVDPSTGEIRLPAPAGRRYLVTWDGAAGAGSQTSPVLGLAPEADASPGTGSVWFVLAQPGSPSFFELRNRYPLAPGTTGAVVLAAAGGGAPVPGFSVSQAPNQDWFEVAGGAGDEAPFFDALSGSLRGLYPRAAGPAPPPAAAVLPWVFQIPASAASGAYTLGTDVEPSSLAVVRNGLPTAAYRFDPAAGTLKFDGLLFETDTVEISYQRKKTGAKASDLILWQGGRWDLGGGQDLQWNLQGRWNLDQGRFTTEDLQAPGRMAASLAYRGAAGEWTWGLGLTGGALLADSTGHRRLYSQTNAGTQASLDGNALRPPAAPGPLKTGSDGIPFASPASLTEANRAFSYFRDYWSFDPLTGQAQAGPWGTPGVGRSPRTAGGWTGPFLVRGDGLRTERLAAADADLKAGEWTGVQVFLDRGRPRDLRSASTVSVAYRLPLGWTGLRVFFQAGTLSGDLDGTGAVKKVEYRSKPALAVTGQNPAGLDSYFPIPEDSSWGNDASGSGSPGQDGALVVRELTASGTGWQTAVLNLTDAERQALQRTTGWRLTLVNGSSGPVDGAVLLAGPVVFSGSSWSAAPDPSAPASSSLTLAEQADSSWTDGHKLTVSWTARQAWTVEGRHSPVRPASFRTLAFRYRVDQSPGATFPLTLTLADSEGRRLQAAWDAGPASGAWRQVRIDLRAGGMTLDGSPWPAAAVSLVPGAAAWDRMTLSYAAGSGGPTAGVLSLSEIECVDPVWEPVGTSQASASWKQTSPWPSAGLPLVSGLAIGAVSSQSGLSSEDFAWRGQTTLSGNLGPVRAAGEASFVRDARSQKGHGAYEATLPLGWTGGPLLELTDQFSDSGLRADRAALTLPWAGTLEARAQADGPPATLVQAYRLGWTSSPLWAPGWGGTLAAGWTQTTLQRVELADFGRQWADSWAWLVPGPDPAPFALVSGEASAKGTWGPVSWALGAKNQVSQSLGPPVKWAPAGSWEAQFPVQAGEAGSWTLVPSLSRRAEGTFTASPVRTPGPSARDAAAWLWGSEGALAAPPFAEWLPGPGPWDQGPGSFPSGTTETKAGLDWLRTPASDWTDLLPLGLGATVTGLRGQEGTGGYRAGSAAVRAQARGLNLFGVLGASPVFSWYRTETLTWAASGAWATGTRDQDKTASAGLDLRADLVLSGAETLGLPAAYKGQWGATASQTLGLKPSWSLRFPADLPFELPRWLSPKAFRRMWVQDLSAAVDLGWAPTPAPVVRNLEAVWKGRLLMSDKSELSLTTKWGQQWQQNLTVVGLQASLDLILTF